MFEILGRPNAHPYFTSKMAIGRVMNNESQIAIINFKRPSPVIKGVLLPVHNGMILLIIWISFKVQKAVFKTLDRLGTRHINTIIRTNMVILLNIFLYILDIGLI